MPRIAKNRHYISANVAILTGTAAYANVIAARTGYNLFITKITLSITTHVAADRFLVDDDGSGPEIAAHTDAAAGAGVPSVVEWNFGDEGTPVVGNVDVSHSSTAVARMHIEGFFSKA